MAEVTFGLDKNTGAIRHVSEVESGLRCNCYCLQCGKELKSAKGEVQEHHFKHHDITNCNASFESILHLTAKKILLENKSFNTSQKGRITYVEAELEKVDGMYRYDVYLTTDDKPIVIEIIVTCSIEPNKLNYLQKVNQRAIALDLSSVDRNINYSELEHLIIDGQSFKQVIYWDVQFVGNKIHSVPDAENNNTLYWALVIGGLLLLKPVRERISSLFKYFHS